ncbi:MAG: hypothetical protein LBS60_01785 [Deltaproteobacteria bacterium]|jgi:hypothetical protein|nr:hypothetical protein [Deltaproteobacteria bacterium]
MEKKTLVAQKLIMRLIMGLILGLILLLFVGLGSAISPAAWAQSSPAQTARTIDELDLPFWPGARLFDDPTGDTVIFTFFIDLEALKNKKAFKSLDKLVVTSDQGKIVFDSPIDLAKSSNFIAGRLKGNSELKTILINQAFAIIDGHIYDLSGNVRVAYYQDLTVIKSSPEYLACPKKVLNFAVYEGVFTGIEEGDSLYAVIDMNGKVESFVLDNELDDFFTEEKNFNKRVKIFVENVQTLMGFEAPECVNVDIITKYILLSPAIKGK